MTHLYRDIPRRRAALLLAAAVLALGFAAPPAHAQAKITRLVVAFPPGGPVDFVARTIGEQLGKELGSQVIVDFSPLLLSLLIALQTLHKTFS